MRTSIFVLALIGIFAFGQVDAKPRNDSRPKHVSMCDSVKYGTRGLHGLCVSFCAQQGNSHVDLNDTDSVRAASSDVRVLHRYNRLRRAGDPPMPCLPTRPDDDDDDEDDEENDDGDDEENDDDEDDEENDDDSPPPADEPPLETTSCPCWSGTDGAARLASIDGVTTVDPSYVKCASFITRSLVTYKYEVKEGEGSIAAPGALVGVAWASTMEGGGDGDVNTCFIDTAHGKFGVSNLGLADAQQCVQEIANRCAAMGNP